MSDTLDILQISPRIPWPLAEGGAVGIYNITRFLAARGHRITFVTFGDAEGRRPGIPPMSPPGDDNAAVSPTGDIPSSASPYGGLDEFADLVIVPHSTKNSVWGAIRNLFSREPYTMSKYLAPAMFAQLDALCAARRFDVVHVDHVHMAAYGRYVRERWGIPYLLREHNFETTIHRRFAEQARLPLAGAYLRMQSDRLLRFETTALRHPDVVAAITEEDADAMRGAVPRYVPPPPVGGTTRDDGAWNTEEDAVPRYVPLRGTTRDDGAWNTEERPQIIVIPAGVDAERITPVGTPGDAKHVVLAGPMHWAPNADAAQWFLAEIWPRVARAVPGARCTVAGAHPTKRILRIAASAAAADRVAVPGFVEDFRALLASATVMAVPLRVGGGMRIKLLEYFAHGKAVVSTPVGAEGNEAQDGSELLIASGAAEFAGAVVRLLENPDLATDIGRRARALAERRYAWTRVAAAFEAAYRDAIDHASPDQRADHRDPAGGDAEPPDRDTDRASRSGTHPTGSDPRHDTPPST